MDTKALRQKVLDLAIRGKLVPQDPNDEPASVLLERIRQEKQQMVKEGKLKPKDIKNDSVIFKGDDNLHYEKFADGSVKCIEDEIPFEIPDSWAWCRLCSIGSTNIGLTYSPNNISDNGTIVLRSSNIVNGKIDFSDIVRVNSEIKENQYIDNGDILICARNGSKRLVGKCAIIRDKTEPLSFGAFMAIFRSRFNEYIIHYFNTDIFRSTFITDDSKQINQLTQDIIKRTLLPLPPIAEQRLIVSKTNSILKQIEEIEQYQYDLESCLDIIKSKILDLAIRGKLVPQNPDDEPASVLLERIRAEKEELIKQGKIKRDKNESVIFKGDDNSYYEKFTNGNIKEVVNADLFDIPNNWNWCMIRDIAQVKGGKRLPKGTTFSVSKTDHGYIRVVDMKNNSIVQDNIKYIDEKVYDIIKNYTISSKDLYVTIAGSIGVVGEIPELNNGMNLTENAAKITQISINKSFLCLVLQSSFVQKQFRFKTFQVAMPKLALERILTTFIPVPPIEEQERILNTVKLYFKSLENIKKSLE